MFVFWYCHKRGREVRLAREAGEGDVLEVEVSDEDGAVEMGEEELAAMEKDVDAKADMLGQPDSAEVPLPEKKEEEVGAGEKTAETGECYSDR